MTRPVVITNRAGRARLRGWFGAAAVVVFAGGMGAGAALAGSAVGNTGRAPVSIGDARTLTRDASTTSTTSTVDPYYRGRIAFTFGTGFASEDAPETVAALAACAQYTARCDYTATGDVVGQVSGRLTRDLIRCGRETGAPCHVERDADGSRSVYDGPPEVTR